MKDMPFPWASVGAGPEPQLAPDFAARAIEKAQKARMRRHLTKIVVGATAVMALLATVIWLRPTPARQEIAANDSIAASNAATSYATNYDSDLLAIMMPDVRQAERFDRYYGPAGWTAYASWNPVSNDSYR